MSLLAIESRDLSQTKRRTIMHMTVFHYESPILALFDKLGKTSKALTYYERPFLKRDA